MSGRLRLFCTSRCRTPRFQPNRIVDRLRLTTSDALRWTYIAFRDTDQALMTTLCGNGIATPTRDATAIIKALS
jgi:hypothetical protein